MIKQKSHRSIFLLCATLLWVGLWAGLWAMSPDAVVYGQAESTAVDEENADTSEGEESAVEEKEPERPKNLRSTEIKGMLPGGEFAKIWLGLEPAFYAANVNIFAEWDRPNALQGGVGFYILDDAGLREVIDGQQPRNVSISSGDDLFEGFDHQMDATFKTAGISKYTIIVFNDSQGDANFTMRATNAFILDDSGQVEDLNAPSGDDEATESDEAMTEDESDAAEDVVAEDVAVEDVATEEPSTATPEPTETPVAVEEVIEDVVEEVTEDTESEAVADEAESAPEQMGPKIVEGMVLSGDLPTQFSMHFLSVRPSQLDGTIRLLLQFDPRDNSEILRKLNFWVLDARSLQLYFDPNEDVRLHEIAKAAGSPTFRGFSNERVASFQALQLSEYTVIVYNDANVPGNYTLTVEGGILIDRDNQTKEALQGGSVEENVMEDQATEDEVVEETEETVAEVVADAPTPVPPTPVQAPPTPVPPTAVPVPPTIAPIGPLPTLPPPSLPPTPIPPPPPPTPVPPTPVPPPPPPTPVPPPPPPPTPVPPPPTPVPPPPVQPIPQPPAPAPAAPVTVPQPVFTPAPIVNLIPEPGLILNPYFIPIQPGFELAPGITPQPFFIPDPNYVPPQQIFVPDASPLPQPASVQPAPISPSAPLPAPELPPTPAPQPAPASAAPARNGVPGGTYVVQPGDSAALIARDIYGDYKFFTALCSYNGLSDCNVIEVGDTLNLPTQEQISAGIASPAPSVSTSTSSSTSSSESTVSNAAPTAAPTAMPTEAPTATPAEEAAPAAPSVLMPSESLDIVDTLIGTGNFKNLVTALEATNLSAPLRTPGPFTLFAPSDAAFDALPAGALQQLLANPEGQLTQILLYHVIPGQLYSNALSDGEEVPTQQGSSIFFEIQDNFITVNGANASIFDIQATNGVIHVIDAVILPPID